MLRLTYPTNKFQKRLIRPLYAQTQATPYAATLDPSLRNTDGSIRVPVSTDTSPFTRSATAFSFHNSLVPSSVMVRTTSDAVSVATGNATEKPFGLLANFVGGDFDDVGDINSIGVWRGPDSVFEVIAPGFNDAGSDGLSLSSALSGAGAGVPVLLYAGTDGRLTALTTASTRVPVARLVERTSAARIVIDLAI